jgi:hypothetical protein
MPSPFPGMDPYLEQSDWVSVHTLLATEIARSLAPRLLPKYIVLPEKVYVLSTPTDADVVPARRRPDVSIVEVGSDAPWSSGSAVATVDAPVELAVAMPDSEPQLSVEVRDAADRSLVTAIEVMSTTDKRGEGRAEYLSKRNRILRSDSHLLEIDLLRGGQRMPMDEPLPSASYFVVLSRAERRPMANVWPIQLRSRLPTVPVPLRGGDPDVQLDLQAVLTSIYDLFGLGVNTDYRRPLSPPLPPADATWAADLLARRPPTH